MRLLYFWRYLTLFEPHDDNIKRKTGSSYRNIEKNFFDSWTNIADLDLYPQGSKVCGQFYIWKRCFRYTTLSENMICKNIIHDFVKWSVVTSQYLSTECTGKKGVEYRHM
jgi:hypothetical protein